MPATSIIYAGSNIVFSEDLEEFFCVKANSDFLARTFQILFEMPSDLWTDLNANDTNYYTFVKSCIFIKQHQLDLRSGFDIIFNSKGRPFGKMRKITIEGEQLKALKNYFEQKVVRMCNIHNFTTLDNIIQSENTDMATKKANTPVATIQILKPETVNASFAKAREEMDSIISEFAEIIDITTPDQAKKASGLVKSTKTILKQIEEVRVAQKAPYKNAGDLIDDAAKMLTEQAKPQVDRVTKLVMGWDAEIARQKKESDDAAEKLRQKATADAEVKASELNQAKENLVKFENDCAKAIIGETDQKNLVMFWVNTLKPFEPSQAPESLVPDAEAAKARLVELGTAKDKLLTSYGQEDQVAISDAQGAWEQQQAKYAHLATQAVTAIENKVSEQSQGIALDAEVQKSQITSTQLSNVPEKNLGTRRVWKYRVLNITMVPPSHRMTIANDEVIRATMAEHKAEIEAGLQGLPGIEFYYEDIASGR